MDEQDEQQLIARIRSGDAGAFRALLDHHYMTLYKIAYHLCGQREDAEDITQMASLKIAQNIAGFRQDSKFTTWMYTIVRNTWRDWTDNRANTGKGRIALDDAPVHLQSGDNPERAAMAQQQLRWLSSLPAEERETVVLVFAHGCSHKEAADILGCAESTVSWRVHEVRKKRAAEGGGL